MLQLSTLSSHHGLIPFGSLHSIKVHTRARSNLSRSCRLQLFLNVSIFKRSQVASPRGSRTALQGAYPAYGPTAHASVGPLRGVGREV